MVRREDLHRSVTISRCSSHTLRTSFVVPMTGQDMLSVEMRVNEDVGEEVEAVRRGADACVF